jgi:hypothetical protein
MINGVVNMSKQKITAGEIAAALAHKHSLDFFMTEVKDGSTYYSTNLRILDALAIKKSWVNKCFVGYEIKTSRSDFKADNKMLTYLPLVHQLYLVCPKGMIKPEELPTDIGLIWYNPENKSLYTKRKPPARKIDISMDMLLYIIYSRLDNDRIPFYSSIAEYYRDWTDNKISNKDLGQKVNNKMLSEIRRLETKLSRSETAGALDDYEKLLELLVQSGMPEWNRKYPSSVNGWVTERIEADYPKILDDVQNRLEGLVRLIVQEKTAFEKEAKIHETNL